MVSFRTLLSENLCEGSTFLPNSAYAGFKIRSCHGLEATRRSLSACVNVFVRGRTAKSIGVRLRAYNCAPANSRPSVLRWRSFDSVAPTTSKLLRAADLVRFGHVMDMSEMRRRTIALSGGRRWTLIDSSFSPASVSRAVRAETLDLATRLPPCPVPTRSVDTRSRRSRLNVGRRYRISCYLHDFRFAESHAKRSYKPLRRLCAMVASAASSPVSHPSIYCSVCTSNYPVLKATRTVVR